MAPRSRRPLRVRPKTWTSPQIRVVDALREDFPMWGKAKLGPLLQRAGFVVSDAAVGRILKSLMDRGVVQPVPNPILDSFQHLYNHHRPHGALGGRTPAEYLATLQASEPPPSHMS